MAKIIESRFGTLVDAKRVARGSASNIEKKGAFFNFSIRLDNDDIREYSFTDSSGTSIGAEYTLVDPVDPVEVPGPLPLLGLAPLAYYFRKLKRSLKKN